MRFLALLLILGLAPSARAWEPPPQALNDLAQGHPWLEVRPDPDGSSGLIRAVVDIASPPDTVWRVLTDCALAPRMARTLKSCRVVERDPQGRWDVREHVSRPMLFAPSVTSVFRSDYDPPRGYRFQRTGGDLKVLEGEWRLISLAGGTRTRVFYDSRASTPFAVPRPIVRIVLRDQVGLALAALRRECLARR